MSEKNVRNTVRNIRLEIEYDGTNYCGWQVQKSRKSPVVSRKSIQGTIERVLSNVLQEKIRLIASGRTDAGVHAQSQIANFKTASNIELHKLHRALNGLLPQDIAIVGIEEKNLGFHSRFAVRTKTYRYAILNRAYPSALIRHQVYFYPYPLNIKLMQEEVKCLLGRHDFKAFCASGSNTRNTFRIIKKISIKKIRYSLFPIPYSLLVIDIEADGFLYNMVRNIVGTLLEIGRHKLRPGSLKRILLAKDRTLAGPTSPAKGLCLIKVKY